MTKRLGLNENDQKTREKNAELFKQHEKVSAQLRELYAQRDSDELEGKELTNLESHIAAIRKEKNALSVRIDNAKDAERNAGRQAELSRKRAQQAVLDEAHVICATLSGSGHDMFRSLNIEFETVIIDEAAQCVEMSSLIPLKYGCCEVYYGWRPETAPTYQSSRRRLRGFSTSNRCSFACKTITRRKCIFLTPNTACIQTYRSSHHRPFMTAC